MGTLFWAASKNWVWYMAHNSVDQSVFSCAMVHQYLVCLLLMKLFLGCKSKTDPSQGNLVSVQMQDKEMSQFMMKLDLSQHLTKLIAWLMLKTLHSKRGGMHLYEGDGFFLDMFATFPRPPGFLFSQERVTFALYLIFRWVTRWHVCWYINCPEWNCDMKLNVNCLLL